MMHGYLAFDDQGQLVTPFRTWRNTNTGPAAERLSTEFGYNIPLRWSVAHLYQALLNREDHVGRVASLTTLAGYVHWQLTGERVVGVGDASGMFAIEVATGGYDAAMLRRFDQLAAEAGRGADVSRPAARDPDGRGAGRRAHPSGREAARPERTAAPGCAHVSTRDRRGNGELESWKIFDFAEAERDAWIAHGLRPGQVKDAAKYRDAGLLPGDLAQEILGWTVLKRLRAGESPDEVLRLLRAPS
jgi:hypothetical protein